MGGLFSALLFKFSKFNEIPIMETVMFWSFSYLSYMLGEAPGFSGIISTLFCGFIMRHYAYHNLSDKGKDLSIDVIKFLATTADTVIFINLGFAPFAFRGAVAFVLALELIDGTTQDYWLATTIAVIFFTVFLLGGTTALLVKLLGIKSEGEKMV